MCLYLGSGLGGNSLLLGLFLDGLDLVTGLLLQLRETELDLITMGFQFDNKVIVLLTESFVGFLVALDHLL